MKTRIAAKIREDRRQQGLRPNTVPTQKWLRDNGYGGIESFANRQEMTVTEVLSEMCDFEPRKKSFGIRHAETKQSIQRWLEKEEELFGAWKTRRLDNARTHIRTLVSIAQRRLGSTNLLRIVTADPPEDVRLIEELLSGLAEEFESEGAQSNYTRTLERWAEYEATRRNRQQRVGKIRAMMSYDYERRSPEHELTLSMLQDYWAACETLEEQALFVLLVASGARRREPTTVAVPDLRLDRDDPYIVFDETRKTGAATVPIMAGVDVLESWVESLPEDGPGEENWLFPSPRSEDGSRPKAWVNKTVRELVQRSGVTFPDGEEPTPKSFRQYWYQTQAAAKQEWLAHLDTLADEQGVSSSRIIDLHYLTGKAERDHFRRYTQSKFASIFGDERVHGIEAVVEARDEEQTSSQREIADYMDSLVDEAGGE